MARSETKRDVTRRRILDSAAHVFREHGYRGARLSDIAAGAGIQTGSLYYHFASREDLVEAMICEQQSRTSAAVCERVDALPAGSTPLARLAEAVIAHTFSVLTDSDYTSASIRIIGQVPPEIHRRRSTAQRDYGAYWHTLLSDAQESGEIRRDIDLPAVRMLLLGGMNSTTEWYHGGYRLDAAQLADCYVSLFLQGASTRRAARRAILPPSTAGNPEAARAQRSARGDATYQRILHAAGQTFRDRGYAGTRMTDIAEAAGIHHGGIYHYFESRDQLVGELMMGALQQSYRGVRDAVDGLPQATSAADRICTAIAAHLRSILENPASSALVRIMGQVPEEIREHTRHEQRAYARYWRDLFLAAVESGTIRGDVDVDVTQMVVLNALNWTVEWYKPDGRLSPEDLANEFASIIFDGLAVRGRKPHIPRPSREPAEPAATQ